MGTPDSVQRIPSVDPEQAVDDTRPAELYRILAEMRDRALWRQFAGQAFRVASLIAVGAISAAILSSDFWYLVGQAWIPYAFALGLAAVGLAIACSWLFAVRDGGRVAARYEAALREMEAALPLMQAAGAARDRQGRLGVDANRSADWGARSLSIAAAITTVIFAFGFSLSAYFLVCELLKKFG